MENRRSERWVMYLSDAQRLKRVLMGENPKINWRPKLWDAHNKILLAPTLWEDVCTPQLVEDDDWEKLSFIPSDE
jgi:hypothetical protein